MIVTDTGLSNIPNWQQIDNLETLITKVLDQVREAYGKPIKVNSGFRSPEVNKAIGGAKNSEHMCLNGSAAADITAGDSAINKELFDLILSSGIVFNQCIDEKNYRWIHISYNKNGNRHQILHLK